MTNKYDQKHKVRKGYQNLSEEEKDKSQRNVQGRYQSLSEERKQKLLECMKNYYLVHEKVS